VGLVIALFVVLLARVLTLPYALVLMVGGVDVYHACRLFVAPLVPFVSSSAKSYSSFLALSLAVLSCLSAADCPPNPSLPFPP
jgi:hypothetical protein